MQALLPLNIQTGTKEQHLSFVSKRAYAPRPLSEATEFSDTEFEDDYPDESYTARSASSQTTISTLESLKTPDTAGLGGFQFHFEDMPGKQEQSPVVQDAESVDLYFGLSPIGNIPIELPPPKSPPPEVAEAKHSSPTSSTLAQPDETRVRNWTPEEVADYMCDVGFDDSVIDKFLHHDISGQILLELQYDDLRELEIEPHGKRNAVLDTIKHLRQTMRISLAPMLPKEILAPQESRLSPKQAASPKLMVPVPSGLRHELPPQSRRGRQNHATSDEVISPGESVSIVAIEQVLPKEHVCTKGEACKKWQKQQRKIQQLKEEMQAIPETPMTVSTTVTRPSDVEPSVVASSDVLGPGLSPVSPGITSEKLRVLQPVDPQESVRQFLGFQHLSPTSPNSQPLTEKLRHMPKLTIPATSSTTSEEAHLSPASHHTSTPRTVVTPVLRRSKTPISAIRRQSPAITSSRQNSVSYNINTPSSTDVYRLASPFSELDVPVTAFPADPLARDTSQSVPPEMRFGGYGLRPAAEPPAYRPQSTQPEPLSNSSHRRHPSYIAPKVPLLKEEETPLTAISSSKSAPTKSSHRRSMSSSYTSPKTALPPSPFPGAAFPSRASFQQPSPPPRPSTTAPLAPFHPPSPPPRPSTTAPTSSRNTTYTHVTTPYPNSPYAITSPSTTNQNPTPTSTLPSTTNSLSSTLLPQHQGPLRRRRTTKLLRHEWQDAHFTLTGTQLAMYRSAESVSRNSRALDFIDVDDYAVACSSVVSGKKLGSGFARGLLGRRSSISGRGNDGSRSAVEPSGPRQSFETRPSTATTTSSTSSTNAAIISKEPAFAFSLIPATTDSASPSSSKKNMIGGLMSGKQSHYFASATRDERIDWMRELMLAKALRRGREIGGKVEVNGVGVI